MTHLYVNNNIACAFLVIAFMLYSRCFQRAKNSD